VQLDDIGEVRLVDFRNRAKQFGERFERVGCANQADAAIDLDIGGGIVAHLPPDAVREKAVAAEESDRNAPAAPGQLRAALLDEGIECRQHRPHDRHADMEVGRLLHALCRHHAAQGAGAVVEPGRSRRTQQLEDRRLSLFSLLPLP